LAGNERLSDLIADIAQALNAAWIGDPYSLGVEPRHF